MEKIPLTVGYNQAIVVGSVDITTEFKKQFEKWIEESYGSDNMPAVSVGFEKSSDGEFKVLEFSISPEVLKYAKYRREVLGDKIGVVAEDPIRSMNYYATDLAGPSSFRMKDYSLKSKGER